MNREAYIHSTYLTSIRKPFPKSGLSKIDVTGQFGSHIASCENVHPFRNSKHAVSKHRGPFSDQARSTWHTQATPQKIILGSQILFKAVAKQLRFNNNGTCNLTLAEPQGLQPVHCWLQVLLNAQAKKEWKTSYSLCNLTLAEPQGR